MPCFYEILSIQLFFVCSVPMVSPTRPRVRRAWRTPPRSTCATTLTKCPTARSRARASLASSVRPPPSCPPMLWLGGNFLPPFLYKRNPSYRNLCLPIMTFDLKYFPGSRLILFSCLLSESTLFICLISHFHAPVSDFCPTLASHCPEIPAPTLSAWSTSQGYIIAGTTVSSTTSP